MNTTRETKEFTTPSGFKVEIKTYITGREKRELTNVFLTNDIKFNSESKDIAGINANLIDKAQDLALKTIVVSIDDSTEGIVETILDMKVEDYNAIVKAVNEVQNLGEEKKTL